MMSHNDVEVAAPLRGLGEPALLHRVGAELVARLVVKDLEVAALRPGLDGDRDHRGADPRRGDRRAGVGRAQPGVAAVAVVGFHVRALAADVRRRPVHRDRAEPRRRGVPGGAAVAGATVPDGRCHALLAAGRPLDGVVVVAVPVDAGAVAGVDLAVLALRTPQARVLGEPAAALQRHREVAALDMQRERERDAER